MIISQTTESLIEIAAVIARGGVIAFRTDTFYGLGADPFNRDAVQRIKQLKGREDQKPILIIISNRAAVSRFIAEPTPTFDRLTEEFWPGPLTLIGRAMPTVPDEITAGSGTIGVRLPSDERVRVLVEACGGALTATSANPSTQEPARTALEVLNYFSDEIDLIVDGGEVTTDHPSTVVDTSRDELALVREGTVLWSDIRTAIVIRKDPK